MLGESVVRWFPLGCKSENSWSKYPNCSPLFKYLSRSLLRKGVWTSGVTPPKLTTTLFPIWSGNISFTDDVAVILLLGVSFMLHHNSESPLPVAKFIVPDWGDKVDSGIGLSYRPARQHLLAGRYDLVRQPYAGFNYILQSWTMNLDTVG